MHRIFVSLLVMLVVVSCVSAQEDEPKITFISSEDFLAAIVDPGNGAIDMSGIYLGKPGASPRILPFDIIGLAPIATEPKCFVLRRFGSRYPLPDLCVNNEHLSRENVFIQDRASSDIFWFDPFSVKTEYEVRVGLDGEPETCGSDDCTIVVDVNMVPTATLESVISMSVSPTIEPTQVPTVQVTPTVVLSPSPTAVPSAIVHVYNSREYLVVYVEPLVPVELSGLEFLTLNGVYPLTGAGGQRFLEANLAAISQPTCLVLKTAEYRSVYPGVCTQDSVQFYVEDVVSPDIFWYNNVLNWYSDYNVRLGDETLAMCSGTGIDCKFSFP